MTLQQLQYFLAAAEHGSFSAAAFSLHMAQPSMSEQIRRLEAELGVPLFIRAGRGTELTDAGRLFRPHAERVLAEAQEAVESVRESREISGGTVAFGFFGGAHHSLLGGVVTQFRKRYPDVRVRAIGQNSAEVADAVRDGLLEAGLVILPIEDRGLEVRFARSEELLYISADPERVREPITVDRLAAAPLILYDARWAAQDPTRVQLRERVQRAGLRLEPVIEVDRLAAAPLILYDARWAAQDPTRVQLRERAQRAGLRLEPVIEVEYMTAAFDLAARGLGDTVGLASLLTARKLHTAPFDPPIQESFAFITRRNARLSPSTRAFMELAERALA